MRQMYEQQQKQQQFIQQQNSIGAVKNGRPQAVQQQNRQMQFVHQRTTPVVSTYNSTLSQQRPQQAYAQDHRLTMPHSGSPGRKPWDLNLQAPRRQSGIEVVSRKPANQQDNRANQFQTSRHQQQQFGIQPLHGQRVLAADAPLRPGFQIYNGQLIEVRATNSFNMSLQHQQPRPQEIYRQNGQRQNDVKMFQNQKRPGWDSNAFSVSPSSGQLSQAEKEAIINERKQQATEKLIKKNKMKATKLIWDPIGKLEFLVSVNDRF